MTVPVKIQAAVKEPESYKRLKREKVSSRYPTEIMIDQQTTVDFKMML